MLRRPVTSRIIPKIRLGLQEWRKQAVVPVVREAMDTLHMEDRSMHGPLGLDTHPTGMVGQLVPTLINRVL